MATPEIIKPDFTKIADKLIGAEGPVFDKNGKFFMVAPTVPGGDSFAGEVVTVDLESKEVKLVCKPRDGDVGGIPAGCQCDKENNIWIADMRLGILKMDTAGNYQQVFRADKDGRPLQGCNDCIFDYDGNLWVTAPAGDIAPAEYKRSSKEERFGSVYCVTADTKELIRIDGGIAFPNGIAVLHDADNKPKTLIVAETPTKILWQYDIQGPGKVGKRSEWGKLPGDHEEGGPDGMDFDEDNHLIAANWGGGHLEVFSPSGGDPVARIKCPFDRPSNIHFSPGTSTAYITEHDNDAVWQFKWRCVGKKQFCDIGK